MYTTYIIHESKETFIQSVDDFNNESELVQELAIIIAPDNTLNYCLIVADMNNPEGYTIKDKTN